MIRHFAGIDYRKLTGGLTGPSANLRKENRMNSSDLRNNVESFTPEHDVTETTPDGRTIQIAVAGTPIPLAEAKKLGLVEVAAPEVIPTEKATAPAKNKVKTPSENK